MSVLDDLSPDPLPESKCSFLPTCDILVETSGGFFCSVCYELCCTEKLPSLNVIFSPKGKNQLCSCTHAEDANWYFDTFCDFIKLPDLALEKQVALNQFISHKVKGVPIFELFEPDTIEYIRKDLENLKKNTFKWEDIPIPEIQKRAEFIKQFNEAVPFLRMSLLNTEPFENLISLKYLDMLTETPDYTFGQPIYNNSLNFYTYLLLYFITFYLKKDFVFFEKIDAEDIETYSPLARHYIREANRGDAFLRKKYFNEEFNLVKFAIKLVEKFVVGATWRWIGGQHKAHIYSIQICKMVVECGIATSDECNLMRNAMFLKIQTYRSLEDIIDNDSKTIAKNWIDIWRDGMTNVREYYIEILINALYFHQDNEVLGMLLKIYKESKKTTIKSEEQLKPFIQFNKSILFEDEFARKTMEFLLGYILSQNKIMNVGVTSKKIENIADNFLHIFSNYDDPYLHSLKLMREQDYINFAKDENKEFGPNNYIKQDYIGFANSLKALMNKIMNGGYLYRDAKLLKDIEEIFDAINVKLNYMKASLSNEPRNFVLQRMLFTSGIPMIVFNLIGNLMQYSEILKVKEAETLLTKFRILMEYYLKDNQEAQSSFIRTEIYFEFEKMFYKFPAVMSHLFYDASKDNAQIIISKEFTLDILLDMFKKHYEKLQQELKIQDYNDLSKLLDICALYINLPCYKIFNWIPEYDVRIAEKLIEFKNFFNVDELEKLLLGYEADKMKGDDAKLEFLMNFFSLLQISTAYRYTDQIYKSLDEMFPMDNMKKLIFACKNNIVFRSIFLEIYGNIHIDFKNHLLNNRSSYYFTKPMDMQYEEDPFCDKNYDASIDFLVGELRLVIEQGEIIKNSHTAEQFYNYVNSAIFGNLVKLINYFLVIKEEDLVKLNKYIIKLEELNDFLHSNRAIMLTTYGVAIAEYESPERKNMNVELSKIDDNLLIKRQKKQVTGNCKAIIDICRNIMQQAPLMESKKCLVKEKNKVSRTFETYLRTLNFSNRLMIRKNNLHLPFEKLIREKVKKANKMEITQTLSAFYLTFKHTKMSDDLENNIYITTLRDKSPEMVNYAMNLCSFIHNQLMVEWPTNDKNRKYTLIESLINALFISTESVQECLYKIIQTQAEKNTEFLDKVWIEMKSVITYVKFKTNIDKFWKEAFRRAMLLIKFHQFMCEDNFQKFKIYFGEKKLPNDTIDRVQRWTTIFQKISDNCQWHYNYTKGDINDFEPSHRSYLLPMATAVFENLAEVCTGPTVENQMKVYRYIYDRYNGFLRRYWRNPNTEFYRTKLALLDFMLATAEGMNQIIINLQTINLELTSLNTIIVNSIKQLYYCIGKKDPFDKKKMTDYTLNFKDYDQLLHFFESNREFATHPLLKIALKIFSYIKLIGEQKQKFVLFCKERDDYLHKYEITGQIDPTSPLKEEDLVVYKFLNKTLIKLEIVRDDDSLISYHFEVLAKCLYLSEQTKTNFLKEVDRTSQETKISGLLSNIQYFKIEMENNEKRFKNYYILYKVFGGGNTYYFEMACLLISFIMNIILLVDLQNTGEELLFSIEYKTTVLTLGLIEIGISAAAVVAFFLLSYTLEIKLAERKFLYSHAYKESLSKWDKIYVKYWLALFDKKELTVFLFHILFVALGLTTTYGLLGIDLFAVILLIPSMQYVVRSVTDHINHIASTLVLVGLLIYAYSIFVHLYFKTWFVSDFDGQCDNLSHCFWTILNKAFRNGEGVGGLLYLAYYGAAGGDIRFYGHLFLNISFFLLINTVLLNIILAVLVDTFSQLRQRSDDFEEDSENVCFLCGKWRFTFEQSGIDFEKHIKQEHNLWSYVNFLVFMSEKTEKDCNGVEDELYHKIKKGDTSWFPIDRSISYEKVKEQTKSANLEKISEQNSKIINISNEILNLVKSKFNVAPANP